MKAARKGPGGRQPDRVPRSRADIRVAWEQLPAGIRAALEGACGSRVVAAQTQPGGFSPGLAARVACENGARFFVKAGTRELNSHSVELHRREAAVLADLDRFIAARRLPIPRLRASVDQDPWFALILEDVDGRRPRLPWQANDLRLVLVMLEELAAALTPAPVPVPPIAARQASLSGWRALAEGADPGRLDRWSRSHLRELAALEETWAAHAEGETLLHGDVREDNILLAPAGGVLVDWPHASQGAAFIDVALFAPSVAMQGGPEPADLMRMSPRARRVSRDALRAMVCAIAGYFTASSLRPPPPGLPSARRFQAAQGEVARRWLRQLW